MPQKRDQRNEEKLEALIEALVAEGVLPADWRDRIEEIEQHGDGRLLAQVAREGRGPPSDLAELRQNRGNGRGPQTDQGGGQS